MAAPDRDSVNEHREMLRKNCKERRFKKSLIRGEAFDCLQFCLAFTEWSPIVRK